MSGLKLGGRIARRLHGGYTIKAQHHQEALKHTPIKAPRFPVEQIHAALR